MPQEVSSSTIHIIARIVYLFSTSMLHSLVLSTIVRLDFKKVYGTVTSCL